MTGAALTSFMTGNAGSAKRTIKPTGLCNLTRH